MVSLCNLGGFWTISSVITKSDYINSFQRWQQQHAVHISCRKEQLAEEFDK